jgi:pilus assembly protein CpaE
MDHPTIETNMQVVLAFDTPEKRDFYQQVVLNHGLVCRSEDCVPLDRLSARLGQGAADLVVVTMSNGGSSSLSAIREASRAMPLVLALGPPHDAGLIMEAMRNGATDFLDQNRPREELTRALEKLQQAGRIQLRTGRVIAVVGGVTGSGVTTIASGLAFALAGAHKGKPTALVELDPVAPELAFDLDLELRNHVGQLLAEWERVDPRMLEQAAVEHEAGVRVLAYEGNIPAPPPPPEAYRTPVSLLRRVYDYAVLDAGHPATSPGLLEAVRLADAVVVAVRLDVAGLRLSRKLIKRLDERGVPLERVFPVGCRYGQRGQIAWRKAEESLGMPFRLWIPEDPGSVNYALNHGLPLTQAAPRAKVTQRMAELARMVTA